MKYIYPVQLWIWYCFKQIFEELLWTTCEFGAILRIKFRFFYLVNPTYFNFDRLTKISVCNISSRFVLCPWGIKFLHNFYNGILLILPEQPSVDLHSVVCINLCVRILIDLFLPKTVGGVPAISKPIRAIWFVSFSKLTANWRNISSWTDRYHAKWDKQLHV